MIPRSAVAKSLRALFVVALLAGLGVIPASGGVSSTAVDALHFIEAKFNDPGLD